MKFKKAPLFLSMALATSLMAVPAQAAVNTAGGTGETPVKITAEATTFDVTVPTQIALKVKADGSVEVAKNVAIINGSAGAVKVSNVEISNGTWTLANFNGGNRSELAKEKVDSKKLGLQLTAGGTKVTTDGKATTAVADPANWRMDGKDAGETAAKLPITVEAIATAVSTANDAGETAAKVVFTIGWETQGA